MARTSSLVAAVLSVLSVLSAGACQGPSPGDEPSIRFDPCQPLAVLADPSATASQRAAITAGLGLWNDLARARLSLAGDGDLEPGGAAIPIHFERAAPVFYGLYDPARGELFINDALTDDGQVVTIAHELGHAFGLAHVPRDQRVSVMNPGNLTVGPTSADRDTLATDWGYCPPDRDADLGHSL